MKQFKHLGFNDMGKTTTNKKEQCNLCRVSSSYEGKESRPLKFSELELILIRYKIMLEEEPDRYTEAEFIQQEDYRRELFK